MVKNIITFCILLFFSSCQENEKSRMTRMVSEWEGKQILFPDMSVITVLGKDTIKIDNIANLFKLVSYIDSAGCTSCKLQLLKWQKVVNEFDSICGGKAVCLFYVHPKSKKELEYILTRDKFMYPVYVDENDLFNNLNNFPSDTRFQTFLLDKDDKVIAIGNPVHNPKVKELYFDIIQGKKSVGKELTTAKLNKTSIDLSTFDWRKEKLANIELVNTGSQPLIVDDVVTSCSCTTVEFPRESVASGQSVKLKIKYNAEKPEPFYRTVSIYCNTKDSPIEIGITGEGK